MLNTPRFFVLLIAAPIDGRSDNGGLCPLCPDPSSTSHSSSRNSMLQVLEAPPLSLSIPHTSHLGREDEANRKLATQWTGLEHNLVRHGFALLVHVGERRQPARQSRAKKVCTRPHSPTQRREPVLGAVFREAIRRHVTFLALLLRDGDGMGWDGTQPVGHCLVKYLPRYLRYGALCFSTALVGADLPNSHNKYIPYSYCT